MARRSTTENAYAEVLNNKFQAQVEYMLARLTQVEQTVFKSLEYPEQAKYIDYYQKAKANPDEANNVKSIFEFFNDDEVAIDSIAYTNDTEISIDCMVKAKSKRGIAQSIYLSTEANNVLKTYCKQRDVKISHTIEALIMLHLNK